ncbi:hypothetical protein [Chitinivorax sp. B]|uniref:hypothetical protein n=1 Tax=Chitinivorax sp. B TaxID=2502235 RepID=UPI0010F5D012|nr:hypothetical protein [Chitinivorax sp. B]
MNPRAPVVIGYPRTGFTLLISVIAELLPYRPDTKPGRHALKCFCDMASDALTVAIDQVFEQRGLTGQLLYNPNFRQLTGGPKWLHDADTSRACFRKYIGVRGHGDFTLITSHPCEVLDYYEIIHSHVGPTHWPVHAHYGAYQRFASVRHPAGTVTSACFSLNALTSEYIQRFLAPDQDNDQIRQQLALYKLSDLNFFAALLTPFRSYMAQFLAVADQYQIMRWEDLISAPISTVQRIATQLDLTITEYQAHEIWQRLDHKNLTGAHKHNLRTGHGIVGGWRNWLTNTHLDMIRAHGLDTLTTYFGYEPIGMLDENQYTPFQQKLANAIRNKTVLHEYHDQDLFGFAFNKSNLDLSRFSFKQYDWRTHTRIERSSCTDDTLVMAVWEAAEATCAAINAVLDYWLPNTMSRQLTPTILNETKSALHVLFANTHHADSWHAHLEQAMRQDANETSVPTQDSPAPTLRQYSNPMLLSSIGQTNIVTFAGRFYALPQALGPIDLQIDDVTNLPGVRVANSLDAIMDVVNGAAT